MSMVGKYAVCVRNEGYEESLELRKIYQVLDDPSSEARGFIRVIGEDEYYLYPASWFLRIELPAEVHAAFGARG